MNETDTQVTVAATYGPDGTCTAMTVTMYGNVTHEDIAEAVRLLARPRSPRPYNDDVAATRVIKTWETNGLANTAVA